MQSEVSGMGRRILALLVDLFMLKLADIPLSRTLREMTPSPLVVLVFEFCILLIYSTVFVSRRGQTPGKIMASLRIISADGWRRDSRPGVCKIGGEMDTFVRCGHCFECDQSLPG